MKPYIICIIICVLIIYFIYSKYKKTIKGKIGELKMSSFLKRQEGILYNDLCFKTLKGKTCQIDHVLISKKGIFVIETKNFSGSINASEYKEEWNHFIGSQKNKVYSPFLQNENHIKKLKEILGDLMYFNYVVFVNPFFKINTESKKILKFGKFKKQFKKQYKKLNTLYSTSELRTFKSILDDFLEENKISNKEHIKNVQSIVRSR